MLENYSQEWHWEWYTWVTPTMLSPGWGETGYRQGISTRRQSWQSNDNLLLLIKNLSETPSLMVYLASPTNINGYIPIMTKDTVISSTQPHLEFVLYDTRCVCYHFSCIMLDDSHKLCQVILYERHCFCRLHKKWKDLEDLDNHVCY